MDKQTSETLLSTPADLDTKMDDGTFQHVVDSCQKLLFKTITSHYLHMNPILGSYEQKTNSFSTYADKKTFYKQAKDFFFA